MKGSDLALEVAVENSAGENKDSGTTYWSLKKAFQEPYYDLPADTDANDRDNCGRTVKLISEVAVTDKLSFGSNVEGAALRKRTLDVNSYDVQVVSNTTQDSTGILLENAWLTIADKSNTTGAEVAIGNNAVFTIGDKGKLFIDETCQLEIEWDGASTAPASGSEPQPAPAPLNNGILNLLPGGEIVNNGYIYVYVPSGGGEEQLVAFVESAEGALLYLYRDSRFVLILPSGVVLYGNYRFVDGALAFTFSDGATVEPEKNDEGNWTYSFTTASGLAVRLTLSADDVERAAQQDEAVVLVA